jgi:hypothetical protein
LLEVDGVGGEVPVNDGVAVEVEVEAFLADGGGGEDERPEGGVEGGAEVGAGFGSRLVSPVVSEASGEAAGHPPRAEGIRVALEGRGSGAVGHAPEREHLEHRGADATDDLVRVAIGDAESLH